MKNILNKWFCNVPEEKYLVPLRILNPFIKSFVNPFVDIVSTFLITHLIHFQQVHVLVYSSKFFYWSSIVFFMKICLITKWEIPPLLAKFVCFNRAAKFSAVNLYIYIYGQVH